MSKRTDGQIIYRAEHRLCYDHNTPIAPSPYFDGGYCSLGCRALNSVMEYHARTIRQKRRWRR